MEMGKVINIQDAKIRTVSIGIQSLTINDKQVTLAVFRQLYEEALISDDGTLNGLPWGIVNYHPDKCADHGSPHMHVVWQKGDELRRSRIERECEFGSFRIREAEIYANVWLREFIAGRTEEIPVCYHSSNSYGGWHHMSVGVEPDDVCTIGVSSETAYIFNKWEEWLPDPDGIDYSRGKYAGDFALRSCDAFDEVSKNLKSFSIDGKSALSLSLREAAELFDAALVVEKARRQRWIANTKAIAELPQLFVAV
jgi:hypothetical protein